jgi:hypothetical protein
LYSQDVTGKWGLLQQRREENYRNEPGFFTTKAQRKLQKEESTFYPLLRFRSFLRSFVVTTPEVTGVLNNKGAKRITGRGKHFLSPAPLMVFSLFLCGNNSGSHGGVEQQRRKENCRKAKPSYPFSPFGLFFVPLL